MHPYPIDEGSHAAPLSSPLLISRENSVWVGDFSKANAHFAAQFANDDVTTEAEWLDFVDVAKGISPCTDTMCRDFAAALEQ